MLQDNILLDSDSYKPGHFLQLPKGTTHMSGYIEARGCDIPGWTECTVFGVQMFMKRYLVNPIEQWMIDEADEILTAHGVPFNRAGWQYILNEYDGKLPLEIQAVAEGTILPLSNAMVQVINTDPKLAWLESYVETHWVRAIWYPTTVATQDMYIKRAIRKALVQTSDSKTIDSDLLFKLHDFGARGVSSKESAGIGGCAHLVHFMGTDTLEAIRYARHYYNETMAGFSIPASEHSTITIWGMEQEAKAFENMIEQFAGEGKLYACVSDSYDIYAACDKWFALKDKIVDGGGTLVVRPDSGDPMTVPIKVLDKLGELFGYTVNAKGFKVLPPYLRVIQGDGINHESINVIIANLIAAGWSLDNIAFGMGGGMLQQVNRDTLKFAMKTSAAKVDGLWRDVYKDPITDTGKRSKRGRLALVKRNGEFATIREEELRPNEENLLKTVFLNGKLLVTTTLAEIRGRAAT
jgi:nicotinamide phosphoribosyltransferase